MPSTGCCIRCGGVTTVSFERIGLEQALDEIAAKIRTVIDGQGAEAVGGYKGSGAGLDAAACFLLDDFLRVLGSHKLFSATTIDQSAKIVAADRLGTSGLRGRIRSPAVTCCCWSAAIRWRLSLSASLDRAGPFQKLKAEIARGMKLLIVGTAPYRDGSPCGGASARCPARTRRSSPA